MPKRKISISLDQFIPSSYLGVFWPLTRLAKAKKISKIYLGRKARGDIVVFCRETNLTYLKNIVEKNIPYIYEIDDNFFYIDSDSEIPKSAISKFYRSPLTIYGLLQYLKNAAHIRVYSDNLYKICKDLNPNTKKYNTYFDFNLISGCKRTESNKIKIVYATSRYSDDENIVLIYDALQHILDKYKYKDKIELYLYGDSYDNLTHHNNVYILRPVAEYETFLQKFYGNSFDIGLAPLPKDIFSASKTVNKFREYGACEIAGVYTNTPLYAKIIRNGQNGMLAENTSDSWIKAISELIENDELRHQIQKNALKEVKEKFAIGDYIDNWLNNINSVDLEKEHYHNTDFTCLDKKTIYYLKDGASNKNFTNVFFKLFSSANLIETSYKKINASINSGRPNNYIIVLSNKYSCQHFNNLLIENDSAKIIFIVKSHLDIKAGKNKYVVRLGNENRKVCPNTIELKISNNIEKNYWKIYQDNPFLFFLDNFYQQRFFNTNSFPRYYLYKITNIVNLNASEAKKIIKSKYTVVINAISSKFIYYMKKTNIVFEGIYRTILTKLGK